MTLTDAGRLQDRLKGIDRRGARRMAHRLPKAAEAIGSRYLK